MKHTEPLRLNYEFARVYKRGRFLAGSLVVLHYFRRKGARGGNRLGVTVSKTVSGSVRRNRIKRLLRESYRLQEDLLDAGFDIILTGRQADPPPTFAQVDREVGRLLRRAGIRRQAAQEPQEPKEQQPGKLPEDQPCLPVS